MKTNKEMRLFHARVLAERSRSWDKRRREMTYSQPEKTKYCEVCYEDCPVETVHLEKNYSYYMEVGKYHEECKNEAMNILYESACDDAAYRRDSYEDYEEFADPGGNSALRAAGPGNPRNLPCPTCGEPNRLTPADRELGYQCDTCADLAERGGY